jgi:hypothetical protein
MSGLLNRVLEAHAGRTRRQGLRQVQATIVTRGTLGSRRLPLIGMLATTLLISACAEPQFMAALVEPEHQTQSPLEPVKPMTPQRTEWLKSRCSQLISYFDYYGVSRSKNSDARRNHTRIGAEIDCDRGNYEAGIEAMERLLTNKAFTVPQPDVASTPDGRVGPINTARLPAGRTEQPQQSSAPPNDAAYCATLSDIYRKTAPQHRDPSATVPTAIAQCQSGHTADGIPVLEQALRNEGMTLSRRSR